MGLCGSGKGFTFLCLRWLLGIRSNRQSTCLHPSVSVSESVLSLEWKWSYFSDPDHKYSLLRPHDTVVVNTGFKVLWMGLLCGQCVNCFMLVCYFCVTMFQNIVSIGHSVVACCCWCVRCVCMCSCSLCSKDLQCWLSFHHHFKSLHGIDMQQCTLCKELVPRGVLMVQHITTKHIRPCSVWLRPPKAKTSKKLGTRKSSHTNKKSSAVASPTCSVSLSRLWTLTFSVKSCVCRICVLCAFHSRCCHELCQLRHWA